MPSSRPSSPSRARRPGAWTVALAALALAVLVAGCAPTGAKVTIDGAWVRAAAAGGNSAAYMAITNAGGTADALLSASAAGVTDSAQIHETSTDASGMTGMHPVDRVPLAAAATVKLEPGGYHVMLMNVHQALVAGSTVKLELVFERAGRIAVDATVR